MGCTHLEFDCGGPNCDATNNDRTAHVKCPDFAPWCNCSNGKHGEPDIPFYSTDIADAWKVVEKIKDLELFVVSIYFDGVWNFRIDILQPQDDGPAYVEPKIYVGQDKSAARAICNGALRAVSIGVSE